MGFTGMFSVETILKIIGFGVKVGANCQPAKCNFSQIDKKNIVSVESDEEVA